MALLAVQELCYAYEKGRCVLKNISFDVKEGETLAIVGLSGCGKTTLCNCLCGLIPHVLGGSMKGRVLLYGKSTAELSLPEIVRQVGLVFQDPDNQLVATTIEDELAFGPENLCLSRAQIKETVDELLLFLGLNKQRLMDPSLLSGGQKQLVAIASVLAMQPRILILDEPMSHLDRHGRQLVKDILQRLNSEGITLIIVEHDLKRIAFADRWLVISDGRIVRSDIPQAILEDCSFLEHYNLI